ncbi:MAG: filamentous hemagglutinin N-terminal domain-containing protein, partial [Sulfurospirillaceae bacterium]|nr:filamentous hemagglutinin N-terminal domain-containing protein [Sulfurospirillaceae bacterium]
QTLYAASITVDAVAPSANKATLLSAPNGVPIVNIVAPTASGLSHNKFSNFNVEQQGLILNNSKVVTDTQLAGFISYNPNLTASPASLILNEVTGTSRTLLRGYTEVAGVAADVIIANPNGISVNGGGFINTPNATLTTGNPMLSGGVLQGFDVSSGNIVIEGDGLNTNNIAKVNLYAKALELNAKLYADTLHVATGENTIALDGSVTSKNFTGSGISIDSSALGGIYANTITLKSTDKGIGVNLPPEVFAQNSLTLTADGDIVASKVVADTTLSLTSQSANINLTNDVTANDVTITAEETISISQDKVIKSFQDMTIVAKNINNQGELNALAGTGTNSVTATQNINNEGLIGGYDVDVRANSIDNSGAIYSKNNLVVTAQTLDNEGVIRSNKAIDLFIENTLTNQNEGIIYSDDTLTIAANSAKDKINIVTNHGIIQSDKDIDITALTLNNTATAPAVSQTSTSSTTTISKGSSYDYDVVSTSVQTDVVDIPSDPALILALGDINIDVGTLNNHYSLIASDGDIVLNATLANNVGKIIVSTTSTVTTQYRYEKYCSSSGPSGVCFNHKERAGYRGTFTTTDTTRLPLAGYGIQAKKSISGNVVTLNNISDQLNGALDDGQILTKLSTIDTAENNAINLQKLTLALKTTNEEAISTLNGSSDIDTLVAQVLTLSDLATFKDNLTTLKETIESTITSDKATLSSLEAIVTSIQALGNTGGVTHDTTSLISTITLLKNNITTNEQHLIDFETLNTALVTVADLTAQKQNLIDINTAVTTLFTQNATALNTLNITPLGTSLESVGNTLRAEVNIALDLKNNVEYKIISNDDGLYQTNTHNPLSSTPSVNYNSNSNAIIDNLTLPKGNYGLFLVNKASNHPYLIEANPLFTNYNTFISSDYMLNKLGFRPEDTLKRLGDAMYETQFVNNAIIRLSGDRYLEGYASDKEQFQGLMDNALALKNDLQLSWGIALSYEQIAQLDKNIVWMEEHIVDGQSVLVPQVYLSAKNLKTYGPKITADTLSLHVSDTLTNDSTIQANTNLDITTDKLTNKNGSILSKGTMRLVSNNELENLSGTIQSSGDMSINAGTINSSALTQDKTYSYERGSQSVTLKGKASQFISGGDLAMQTNDDITLKNTQIQATENITLSSLNGNINTEALETKSSYNFTLNKGYNKGNSITNASSSLEGKNINLNANQVNIIASNLTATEDITIEGKDSVNVLAANDLVASEMQIKTKGGLFGGKSTKKDETQDTTVVGSTINAKNINIDTKALSIQGSKLSAEQVVIVSDIIELISLTQSSYENHFSDKSGIMTRTIATKGKIKEEVVPALIEVRNQLIVNNKDITDKLSTDTIVKTLSSQSDLTVEQINLIKAYAKSDEWDKHMTTLSGMGSLIVAAIITICTMGAGTAVVGAAMQGINASIQAAIQAAIHSLVVQATTSLVTAAITGNSPTLNASSLIKGAVTAGVMSYTNTSFTTDALTDNMSVYDYAKNATLRGTVQGVSSEISGGDFKDGFTAGATLSVVSDGALQMRKYIFDNYDYVGDGKLGEGLNGDGRKGGGSHFEKVYENGVLTAKPIDAPTGGSQTGKGKLFGTPYEAGSFTDKVIEHFAGPHDFMSSWNYENIDGVTYLKNNGGLVNTASGLLLIPSIPLAAAPFIQNNINEINTINYIQKEEEKKAKEAISNTKDTK